LGEFLEEGRARSLSEKEDAAPQESDMPGTKTESNRPRGS